MNAYCVALYIGARKKNHVAVFTVHGRVGLCMCDLGSVCATRTLSASSGNGHNGEASLVDKSMFVHERGPMPSRLGVRRTQIGSGLRGWGPIWLCTVIQFKYGLIPLDYVEHIKLRLATVALENTPPILRRSPQDGRRAKQDQHII